MSTYDHQTYSPFIHFTQRKINENSAAMSVKVYNAQGNDLGIANPTIPTQNAHSIRIVCMSDTHGYTNFSFRVPDGDVLSKFVNLATQTEWQTTRPCQFMALTILDYN